MLSIKINLCDIGKEHFNYIFIFSVYFNIELMASLTTVLFVIYLNTTAMDSRRRYLHS